MDVIQSSLVSPRVSAYAVISCLRCPKWASRKTALSKNEECLEISCSQIYTHLSKVIITGNHKS